MAGSDLLAGATFDNGFVRELPGDPLLTNRRRQVNACYSRVTPTPVPAPRLLAHSAEVAALLGFLPGECQSEAFAQVFAGNRCLPGMEPYAACYGGHQFGSWAGQLGDGRAITLGELIAGGQRWELQLKGAGPTPYSRTADGRAVLRSSLREFVCSEAMHHLGVPTTRALSLVATGEDVVRDMFYDGHPRHEPGAVVCRVAPSFLRFGNFELPASRGEHGLLKSLADYTLRTHFSELGPPSEQVYARWFHEVAQRTARMVTAWMRVGFVHGVMNTDNMSVLGLSIDYGPYGFLEDYDPGWTPNTTDASGRRYCYGRQPQIALWNLSCFGSALLPLTGSPEPLQAALEDCVQSLEQQQRQMLHDKLGLELRPEDDAFVAELLGLLQACQLDMTIFYRALAELDVSAPPAAGTPDDRFLAAVHEALYAPDALAREPALRMGAWLRRYVARAHEEGVPAEQRRARMNAVNPKYVFRNYLAQLAIDRAEQGDASMILELLEVLRRPYDEQPGKEAFAQKRPEWARHKAGCSMLSCSS